MTTSGWATVKSNSSRQSLIHREKILKVVVTGAAGFIGSSLAYQLVHQGHEVLALDRDFKSGYAIRNISRIQTEVDLYETDLSTRDESEASAQSDRVFDFNPDLIVHLAAYAGVRQSLSKRELYVVNNSNSTVRACEIALRNSVPLLSASTSSLYRMKDGPTNETDDIEVRHPYALSKLLSEQIVSSYCLNHGLSSLVLRFFTVFGPFGRQDMLPGLLVRSALTDEAITLFDTPMRRDWTYIGDLVNRLIHLSEFAQTNLEPGDFDILNIGSGRPVLVHDFVSIFQEISGRNIKLISAPTPSSEATQTWADTSKLQSFLGPLTPYPIELALRETWQWALQASRTSV